MSERGQTPARGGAGTRAAGDWINRYPELTAQWHPSKNGALGPADLSYGSARKVWWICPHGPDHEWQASPNNRTSGKSGCPFCAGRATSVTNNLRRLYPELAKQWHPLKNGALKPEAVVAGSARPVWWQCPAVPDHEWQAAPHDRSAGKGGCPFCLGMRVAPSASLAELAPAIAAEWHPVRNGRLTPRDVTPSTTRSPWWQCARNPAHEWRSAVVRRASGNGCPACAAEPAGREQELEPKAASSGREPA